MGNFLDILKEIESCRMAGFGRPALFEALMLPDICGETRVSEDGNAEKKVKRKYIRWIEEYVSLTRPCIGYNEEGQLCEQESEKGEYLSFDELVMYKNFLGEMIPKMTTDYMNNRKHKHTARDN